MAQLMSSLLVLVWLGSASAFYGSMQFSGGGKQLPPLPLPPLLPPHTSPGYGSVPFGPQKSHTYGPMLPPVGGGYGAVGGGYGTFGGGYGGGPIYGGFGPLGKPMMNRFPGLPLQDFRFIRILLRILQGKNDSEDSEAQCSAPCKVKCKDGRVCVKDEATKCIKADDCCNFYCCPDHYDDLHQDCVKAETA